MKLKIQEPCNEDWNNMKIGLISRHCDSCNKSVMDFTTKNRGEIITYILSNPNESVCGRMRQDQFDFTHDDIPFLIEALKTSKAQSPFLILALVCLSLASCSETPKMNNIQTPPPIEKQLLVEDTVENKVETPKAKKETKKISDVKSVDEQCVNLVSTKGEVIVAGGIEPEIQGGMEIVEIPEEEIPIANTEEKIHQYVEQMPEFPGGVDSLFAFIKANLKYPKFEKENNIQGNVYVRFVVEKDGSLSRIEILKSVEGSINFDKEVKRLISLMPNWKPGTSNNIKLRVYMTLPIQFKLI
jgi:protein TonB